MTALDQYARLESTGVWRASHDAQRRNVIVSFGNATLVISDSNGSALAHWSLAAVLRLNSGKRPAIFSPDADHGEQVEIEEDMMVDAIETVRKSLERARPKPGRLRLVMLTASFAAVAALAVFWLPDALVNHTVKVVPDVKRAQIGAYMLEEIERVTGQPCFTPQGEKALAQLTRGLGLTGSYRIYRDGVPDTLHLPGGLTLINARVLEDHDSVYVPAGYFLAENLRTQNSDPLRELLEDAGLRATFKLLTTAQVDSDVLARNAEAQLTKPADPLETPQILEQFTKADVPTSPYAYALDPSGEATLALIEGDPMAGRQPPTLLDDGEWISLQGICAP
ncbi:hypothetical protein [Algirhabdus cladophorae]|uniref:hypothetical protein n=1 Tax=Algirhabdus cladophorae TaxID=3377108 RepID=UPI003B848663